MKYFFFIFLLQRNHSIFCWTQESKPCKCNALYPNTTPPLLGGEVSLLETFIRRMSLRKSECSSATLVCDQGRRMKADEFLHFYHVPALKKYAFVQDGSCQQGWSRFESVSEKCLSSPLQPLLL